MAISDIFKEEILHSGGYVGGRALPKNSSDHRRIYKLSSNENYFGCSPKVVEQLMTTAKALNFYPPSTPQELYEALSGSYDGVLQPEQFIAGNSGSEILEIICRAFLSPTSNCILSSPCFTPYQMFSSWSGATIRDVPLLPGSFSLDTEGIIKAVDKDTRILFLTSPNNPTGSYIKKKQLSDLLHRIPDHVVVVFDEVYHQFTDAQDFTTAESFVLEGFPVIAINSFSKAYGLASLRVGYGYTTPEIAQYLRKLIRPFLINKLSLTAACAALSDVQFLQKCVKEIIIQRKELRSGLDRLGLKSWPTQANFVLVQSPMETALFIEKMEAEGIMVRDTDSFGAPGCIRITIGDREATQATLKAIATIIG